MGFDDADVDAAAEQLMACKFRNAGQTCIAANRVLVDEKVKDDFVKAITNKVNALKVGPGDKEGVELGPLIDQDAVDKVQRLVLSAKSDGATIETGGEVLTDLGNLF